MDSQEEDNNSGIFSFPRSQCGTAIKYGSESERSDISFSSDDNDLYVPNDSDGEFSDLSDDLDYMLCREELKDSENFFKDVISRDYSGPRCSQAEIVEDIKDALEKNEILRQKNLELKEKLLEERERLEAQLSELCALGEPSNIAESSDEEVESFDNLLAGDPLRIDVPIQENQSKEEEIQIHQLGRFQSQFAGPYFKDRAGYFCPSNEHTQQMRQEMVCVSDLVGKCKEWTEKQLKQVEDVLKKCLLDEYKTKEGSESIKFKQYEVIVKQFSLDEILKDKDYKFDWMKASALLNSEHKVQRSPSDLEKLWKLYLHPKFNKTDFTAEEEDQIIQLVEVHGSHNWDLVAQELGTHRSAFLVFVHYVRELYFKHTAGTKWSVQEDELLKNLVERFTLSGRIPWGKVMYYFERRSYDQVYNRWNNTLLASKLGRFSPSEDKAIVSAFFQNNLGSNMMKKVLNNQRTYKQIRGRLESLRSIKAGKVFGEFTLEEDQKLVELVNKIGPKWSVIAKRFVSRDRTQLRHRYNKLKIKLEDPSFKLEHLNRTKSDLRSHLQSRNNKLLKLMDKKNKIASRETQKKFVKYQQSLNRKSVDPDLDTYESDDDRTFLPKKDPVVNYLFEVGSSKWKDEVSSKIMSSYTAQLTETVCRLMHARLDKDLANVDDEHLFPVIDLINPPNDDLKVVHGCLFNRKSYPVYKQKVYSKDKSQMFKGKPVTTFDQPSTSGLSNYTVEVNDDTSLVTELENDIDLPPQIRSSVTLDPLNLEEMCTNFSSAFVESGVMLGNVRCVDKELNSSVEPDLNSPEKTTAPSNVPAEESTEERTSSFQSMCNLNIFPPSFANTNAFVNLLFHLSRTQHIRHSVPESNKDPPEVTQAKRLWMKRLYQLFLLPAIHTSGKKKKATIAYERTYMG